MHATLRPILSLLVGLFFLIIGHGLQITLIPLRAQAEGWSSIQIGVLGSAYYVGFLGGCFGSPYLIRKVGHIRTFMALVSLFAATMAALPLLVTFPVWLAIRIVIGIALSGLYMTIESWLNDRASNTTRGLTMGFYIMVNYAALAVGQSAITLYSPMEFSLFAIAALTISLSAIPLALTSQTQPAPVALVRFRPMALYRASPVGLVGAMMVGVANGAFWSLGAVAAVSAGMTTRSAAVFMALATAAGALSQWPVGRLSDRIDRRVVLIGLLVAASVFGVLLAFVPPVGKLWFILGIFFGMAIAPSYSICAAHTYDQAAPGSFFETAAGLFLASATGSIIGPFVASLIMEGLGAPRLFLFTAVVQALMALYAYSRLKARPAPAGEIKAEFDLAASAPVGGPIMPEPLVEPPPPTKPGTGDATA
ncbi:MFS transporter [soil metagenome]